MPHNHLAQPIGFPLPAWRPPPAPPRTPMEGRWCRLEPLDPNRHAEALFRAFAADTDGRGWTYLAYGPFSTAADYRAWMCDYCLSDDPLFFAICPRLSEKGTGPLASGVLSPFRTTFRTAPLGVASYLRLAPAH